MACINKVKSWTTAILHLFSQETDLLKKVIMKCLNIKLWDLLGCFHYILNAPRKCSKISNTFHFLFSKKMGVIRAGIHKILVRKANREDPDKTDLSLRCLHRPF